MRRQQVCLDRESGDRPRGFRTVRASGCFRQRLLRVARPRAEPEGAGGPAHRRARRCDPRDKPEDLRLSPRDTVAARGRFPVRQEARRAQHAPEGAEGFAESPVPAEDDGQPPRLPGQPEPAQDGRAGRDAQPRVGVGHHLHTDPAGLVLPRRGHGSGQPQHQRLEPEGHDENRPGGGRLPAGHLQGQAGPRDALPLGQGQPVRRPGSSGACPAGTARSRA